jgi:hypothetical protein
MSPETTNLAITLGAGFFVGSVTGLIPFFVAKNRGRIKYALSSLVACTLCGGVVGIIFSLPLSLILMAVAFALQKITPDIQSIDSKSLNWRKAGMSKTSLWIGNAVICSLLASFIGIMEHESGSPWMVADLLGNMAEAVGGLLGGLLTGYIATRFMKEATDESKNVAYFCGVLCFAIARVFGTISGS